MDLETAWGVNTMTEKDRTKTNTKRPATPRKGRPSRLPKDRASFGLRIGVGLLNDLRSLADNAQMISLNAYITAVLMHHVTTTKANTTK